jgi:hypothetical protein
MLPLLACIAGILLGLNFNALVLVPTSLTFGAIFIFRNLSPDLGFQAHIWDFLVALFSLQAAYMLGLACRPFYSHVIARFQAPQSNRI